AAHGPQASVRRTRHIRVHGFAGIPPEGGNYRRGVPPEGGNDRRGVPPEDGNYRRGVPPEGGNYGRGVAPEGGNCRRGIPPEGGNDRKGSNRKARLRRDRPDSRRRPQSVPGDGDALLAHRPIRPAVDRLARHGRSRRVDDEEDDGVGLRERASRRLGLRPELGARAVQRAPGLAPDPAAHRLPENGGRQAPTARSPPTSSMPRSQARPTLPNTRDS